MARLRQVAGYTVRQYDSPNKGGTMSDHRGVVLHIAQGTYEGTISWQMNPDQRYQDGTRVTTCSTWIIGRNRGEIAQMADSDRVAWAQRSGSNTWNSIELAGYAPNPPTAWQIEASAHVLVWLHRTEGVPVQVASNESGRGLGHHSMDRESLGVEWGHDACPGSGVINAKPTIVEQARAILAGQSGGFLMGLSEEAQLDMYKKVLATNERVRRMNALDPTPYKTSWSTINPNAEEHSSLAALLLELGGDDVDEQVIIDGILAAFGSLDLESAADSLRAVLGPERAAQLGNLLSQ